MKGTNYNIYISVLHIDILQEVAKQDRKYRKPTINSIKIGIIMKFLVCYTTILTWRRWQMTRWSMLSTDLFSIRNIRISWLWCNEVTSLQSAEGQRCKPQMRVVIVTAKPISSFILSTIVKFLPSKGIAWH